MNNQKNYPLTTSQNVVAALADYVHSMELLSLIVKVEFKSKIDDELFLKALYESVKRLPYCNVRFRRAEDGTVVQYLSDEEPEPIEIVDFNIEGKDQQEEQFREWNSNAFPGTFENIQLYQFKLLRYPDGHRGLFFCLQHFIMDGYAALYTMHYISSVYLALKNGTELPAPGPEPWPLIDMDIAYHASPRYQKGLAKLMKQYETEPDFTSLNGRGAPEFIPGKRYGKEQDLSQFGGSMIHYPLSDEFAANVEEYARKLNISAQNIYLLALRSYLGKVSETNDVTVISLLACRSTLFEKKCGLNVADAQMVRSILPEDVTFTGALTKLADIQNEELRYAKVINNDVLAALKERYHYPDGTSYYSTWLTYYPPMTLEDGEFDFSASFICNGWATTPLYMLVVPDSNHGTLRVTYWYAEGYILPENIERFHSFMLRFLEKGLKAPDKNLRELVEESF